MVSHAATISEHIFSVDKDGRTQIEKARGTTANREIADFVEKILFQSMTKCNKGNKLDVRWQYGLFMGVATRTNEIMVGGREKQEKSWTLQRLPEDRKRDAEAVMNVRRSQSGTEFELKITADRVNTEPIDKAQAKPMPVMPFRVRHKDIVQFGHTPGCKGCRAA